MLELWVCATAQFHVVLGTKLGSLRMLGIPTELHLQPSLYFYLFETRACCVAHVDFELLDPVILPPQPHA